MEYRTNCKLCNDLMVILVTDSDDEASKDLGLNPESWMGKLICTKCSYYKKTGRRPPLSSNVRDFLLEEDENKRH